MPYHAIFEFFEKRLSVINSRNDELRQAVEGVGKSGSNIDQAFRTWANRVGLSQEQVGDIVEGAGVRVAIISLIEQIREVGADNAFETRATQPKIP